MIKETLETFAVYLVSFSIFVKNKVKEEIVKQAIGLFLHYGFKSVTMDEIAQHMRISKKTIYAHFSNKDSLVEEAALSRFNYILDCFRTISKQAKDPIIEIYQLKKEALKHISSEQNSPQYQLQKFYPSLYSKIKEKEFEILSVSFANSLKKGVETGLFRSNINVDFITRIYFNGIRGVTDINLFPPEKYKIDKLLLNFSEYHLRAICTTLGLGKLETYKNEISL